MSMVRMVRGRGRCLDCGETFGSFATAVRHSCPPVVEWVED